jgi:hypothetical protein
MNRFANIADRVASDKLDRIRISKGQEIKIAGIPFMLESDAVFLGTEENLSILKATKSKDVAHGKPDTLYEFRPVTTHSGQ